MLAPQRPQDIVLDVVAGDGVEGRPPLLVQRFGALVVRGEAVLELEAGLAAGHVAVAAVHKDVGEGLQQLDLRWKITTISSVF